MFYLIGINEKIEAFLKTLTDLEKTELWNVVNSPGYITAIAPKLDEIYNKNLDDIALNKSAYE